MSLPYLNHNLRLILAQKAHLYWISKSKDRISKIKLKYNRRGYYDKLAGFAQNRYHKLEVMLKNKDADELIVLLFYNIFQRFFYKLQKRMISKTTKNHDDLIRCKMDWYDKFRTYCYISIQLTNGTYSSNELERSLIFRENINLNYQN